MRTHDARIATGDGNIVSVYVRPETLYNLEATQALTASIMGRYGCTTCHSGIQILYLLEEEEAQLSVEVAA